MGVPRLLLTEFEEQIVEVGRAAGMSRRLGRGRGWAKVGAEEKGERENWVLDMTLRSQNKGLATSRVSQGLCTQAQDSELSNLDKGGRRERCRDLAAHFLRLGGEPCCLL